MIAPASNLCVALTPCMILMVLLSETLYEFIAAVAGIGEEDHSVHGKFQRSGVLKALRNNVLDPDGVRVTVLDTAIMLISLFFVRICFCTYARGCRAASVCVLQQSPPVSDSPPICMRAGSDYLEIAFANKFRRSVNRVGHEGESEAQHFSHPMDELYTLMHRLLFEKNETENGRMQQTTQFVLLVMSTIGFVNSVTYFAYNSVLRADATAADADD